MDNAYKDSMKLKELLAKKLTKKQLEKAPSSFDVIGNKERAVAIVEIDKTLLKQQKEIANAIMALHKNVVSVLLKASPRKGVYRTRSLKLIKGSRKTEVVHVENGCRFLLDPRKVYFSPREGTERLRLAGIVKGDVMVFFAGIGAFPIVLAKHAKAVSTGIEINPAAAEYFSKNIQLNKAHGVKAMCADVRDVAERYANMFEHVVMPLPETAVEYVEQATTCLKSGGIVHIYFFSDEKELKKTARSIQKTCTAHAKRATIANTQKVLPYGPRIWKYRIDVRIEK